MNTDPENHQNAFRALSHPELSTDINPIESSKLAVKARMIAAAPELFQVLGELMHIADDPEQTDLNDFIIEGTFAHARALLAQIKGEVGHE